MPNGIPELGIPPLDPFDVPHFDIPHIEYVSSIISNCRPIIKFFKILNREDIVKVDIKIDNLVITNLATFETKVAHLDLEALSLELELGLEDLRVKKNN